MKNLIFSFLLTIIAIHSYGQGRVNRAKVKFDKTSETLKAATGWAYNETSGQWVDYNNVICSDPDYKDKYKSLLGSDFMFSKYEQNFDSIVTKTVSVNNKTYYVLIVHTTSGRYEYPSIREEWYTYKEAKGYIFTEEEFKKLDSLSGEKKISTQYEVSLGSKYTTYDESKFIDLIQTELKSEKSKYSPTYSFPVLLSNEGKVRFYVPTNFSSTTKYDFNKRYFEIELKDFKKLIIK